jgi:hypothetical protein
MPGKIWTFERDGQSLSLVRDTDQSCRLTIITAGSPRQCRFDDMSSLARFQTDMEKLLLRTGWAFVQFSPESRRGGDRRGFPRMEERRRWWTDGSTPMLKAVWGG